MWLIISSDLCQKIVEPPLPCMFETGVMGGGGGYSKVYLPLDWPLGDTM